MGSTPRGDPGAAARVLPLAARLLAALVVAAAAILAPAPLGIVPRGVHADSPTPSLAGAGGPALLVGSDFGDTRLVALDARGQVVRYGAGGGTLGPASLCPGGSLLVETTWELGATVAVALRDLRSFEIVRAIDTTDLPMGFGVGDVLCRDEDGDDVLLWASGGIATAGPGTRTILPGQWRLGRLSRDAAIVVPEKGANEVHLIDIADGSDGLLYEMPSGPDRYWDLHSIAVSPSGDRVAIVDWFQGDGMHDHTLRLFSLPAGATLYERAFPGHGGTTTAWWVDDDSLAMVFLGDNGPNQEPIWGTVLLVDAADGAERTRWTGLNIYPHLIADGVIIGAPVADRPGTLAAVPVTGGQASVIEVFETSPLQGVHGPFPAPVTAVAVLPDFDGSELLAATAGSPLSDAGSDLLGTLPFVVAAAVGLTFVAIMALAWLRRRAAGETPPGDGPVR